MKKFAKYLISVGILTLLLFVSKETFAATASIYTPTKVNMQKVRTTRISRHNAERKTLGLSSYTGSAKLDTSAQKRAEYLAKINKATHKRKASDSYYNYNSIKERFSDLKINFPKEKSGVANFTENLAYQTYKCTKKDCTDDLIAALKKGFAFFMSEKKYKGPHYKAIIGKQFKIVGMGVGVIGSKYYVVTHYGVQTVK